MLWNFVGRTHDEIVGYRQLWEEADARFGVVDGYRGPLTRLPAPPLPTTRLGPRPIRHDRIDPNRKETT
ncbi:pirin [Mycobacterium lentiflavum]|uniref:Pirin n=1 Tax=Mycobacterium lentiflavum TaxID=141349 RepID=A0A0E4GV44_MYCLN|nr:pirin [Mycobacterium lentiflavum]